MSNFSPRAGAISDADTNQGCPVYHDRGPVLGTERGILAMVEPVTAALFGVVVLDASLEPLQLVGMGLVLLTVTGLSVYSGRQPS